MPIAIVNIGASANPDINISTNQSSYVNSSSTPPTDGALCAWAKNTIAAPGNKPTASGWGVTWVEIATHVVDTGNADRLTLLAAIAAGATPGAVTVDFAGETQLDCRVSFFQITGLELSGGIAAAFTNIKTGNGTGTSGSITLDAPANSNNRPIAAFCHEANEATTHQTNWTEIDDLSGVAPTTGFNTQCREDQFDTAAGASWATSSDWVGLALEIIAAGAATASPPFDAPIRNIQHLLAR